MTPDLIIEGILDREGEGTPPFEVEGDKGGRTSWGISERWHPEAWAEGPPSREQAKAIYLEQYVRPFAWVAFEPLKVQLIDFGVVHGVGQATHCLQALLGATLDGIAGPKTRYGVERLCNVRRGGIILNNALVASRLLIIDQMTDREKSQKKFEEGWSDRALKFLTV